MTATVLDTHILPAETDVAIVGSGFSGLAMALRLQQEGSEDFVVLERDREVGGVWRANTYPGCGCDVPSNLYSLSDRPNPSWSHTYSKQPEIAAYLRRCAGDSGLREKIAFGCDVLDASWDDDAARWEIETARGTVSARVLISAAGALYEPRTPDIPGLDAFEGETFHSARWNHDYDLRGKRVAVIGTGASAIQFVPQIAPLVEQLHVVQRTAPWIMPHPGRPTTRAERTLYRRLPWLQKLSRAGIYAGRESYVLGFVKHPRIMKAAERIARTHMRRQVTDPGLLRKVEPGYAMGCKRILPSNDWYPALMRDNVELVTDGIAEVRANSIVTGDGVEVPVDAIIYGTGFQVLEMPFSQRVHGRDGIALTAAWDGSPSAYKGCTVPGFPNLFMLLGPNTGLGHGSMVYMAESQVAYVADALRTLRERGADAVEVRPETLAGWVREVDAKASGTVWNTGCASWYLDAKGRNAALWPDWTFRFRRRTARFDAERYRLRTGGPVREPVAV